MSPFNVNRDDPYPLVDQIVDGIRRQIADRQLRPGSKLPSIRVFARAHSISRFTVVEAYDRLVAMGCVRSRRGAGFFTAERDARDAPSERNRDSGRNEAMVWLIRRLLEARAGTVLAGGPWLPDAWLDEANIRRTIRAMATRPGRHVTDYGDPYGDRLLREHIAEALLPEVGIRARPSQLLLTRGASQALDLVSRSLVNAGDTVIVDDPGYYNLFGNLRLQGLRLVGVARKADGPDVDALEALALEHKPKLFFTQSVVQNPTGTTMSAHVAYRVLQIAGRHGFRVVEDDICSDLQTEPATRLAALDQLDRVIYIRSFSKTLSGSLRVGFIAGNERLIDDLADAKMVTCITSSQFTEKVMHRLLIEGHYRKYLARLRERIDEARCAVARSFDAMGIEVFAEQAAGMFLWARFPQIGDSLPLAERALGEGVMLAPGTVFRPNLEPSPWLRFNVAICADAEVRRRIKRIGDAHAQLGVQPAARVRPAQRTA